MISILSILGSLQVHAQQTERRAKSISRHNGFYTETKDILPGNYSYGFFIQKNENEKSICRIHIKIECDFGLGATRLLKLTAVNFRAENLDFHLTTDDNGILDGYWKCRS